MAVQLSSPRYSFVALDLIGKPGADGTFSTAQPELEAGCADAIPLCLPVSALGNLNFQIFAQVSGSDKDWFEVVAEGGTKYTVYAKVCVDCETQTFDANSFNWKGTWRKIVTDTTDVWVGNFTETGSNQTFTDLIAGDCFNICFHKVLVATARPNVVEGATTTVMECTTTCFVKITDTCYTTVFFYQNNEDNHGFIYTDANDTVNFTNVVRLPCYLRNMQLPSQERSYIKSNGAKKKLFERTEEEYDLIIDWMPKQWHKNMKVLLGHDGIVVSNDNDSPTTNMTVICREAYEMDWPEEINYPNCPAKTKLVRSEAISMINTNCN